MDPIAFLAVIGFLFLAIGYSLRLLFPGRIGEIALGILLRDLVLLLLRACAALLLLPFRLIARRLSGPAARNPALHARPHRPRHHRRRPRRLDD